MRTKESVILLIAVMLALPSLMNAKEKKDDIYIEYPKNEIYLQLGTPSIVEITNKLGTDTFKSSHLTKEYESIGGSYSGIAACGYNRYLNPYFYMGAYLGFSKSGSNAKDANKIIYSNDMSCVTGMVNFGWTYFRSGIWDISFGVSAGLIYKDETITTIDKTNQYIPVEEDQLKFAFNITAAKIRIGSGVVGGFAEFGFGYKGIANAGISLKF